MAKTKHLFPGGNTPQGFFSYYNYIISSEANRIFVLKGGPGTGKSTFMRKIGQRLATQGYDTEFLHCSSDNNSLDGVVVPDLGIALIDGTAPHIVDPKHPGCVDEIINLGEFWNEKGIARHKAEIVACTAEISKNYLRAYRYLKAAKLLYDDIAAINTEALDIRTANKISQEIIDKIFAYTTESGAGKVRKMFASAITPDGPVHYLDSSVWHMEKCHVIEGHPGTGKSAIIQKVITAAVSKGLDIEVYYCPLSPEKPEHIIIPALNTAVTTSAKYHEFKGKKLPITAINMNNYLNPAVISKYQDIILYDEQVFAELWTKAISCFKHSKQLHDQLETYYIPYMDFQGIQALWEKTLQRILAYANK
jgi:nucleoside-triphosphatase THEP1